MRTTRDDNAGSLKRAGSATPEIYVFERAGGWYPLELKDDDEARQNAELNPGTLKVTTMSGRPVWPNAEVSDGGTRDSRIETAAQSRPSLH